MAQKEEKVSPMLRQYLVINVKYKGYVQGLPQGGCYFLFFDRAGGGEGKKINKI